MLAARKNACGGLSALQWRRLTHAFLFAFGAQATYRNNRRMDGAHGDGIWSACWLGGGSGGAGDSSSSGLRLATGGVDETVKLWSLPAPKAPDGEEKAAEEASATLTCEHELPDHHLGVVTVAASPAGNRESPIAPV